jgi:hypothetical protein
MLLNLLKSRLLEEFINDIQIKKIRYKTAMAYLAAIVDLYQEQSKIGVNNHPHPRSVCCEDVFIFVLLYVQVLYMSLT